MNAADLHSASFKGVPFLISGGMSTEGGRRDVRKAFANTNRTKHEYMGTDTRRYKLEGIISTRRDGNGVVTRTYMDVRTDLLRALESKDPGVLMHPFEGRLENMVCVPPYALAESVNELGNGRVSMTFEESTTDGQPVATPDEIGGVTARVQDVCESAEQGIVDRFKAGVSFVAQNFTDGMDWVNDWLDEMDSAMHVAAPAISRIDSYAAQVGQMAGNVAALIGVPVDLADSVRSVYAAANGLHSSVAETFNAFQQMFGFGDGARREPQDTSARIERQASRDALILAAQGVALAYAYENAAQRTYTTVEQIAEVEAILETQFQKMSLAPSTERETFDTISNLRTVTQRYLDTEKLSARRLTTFHVPVATPRSTRVIAYQHYGTSEDGVLIAQLNNVPNLTFASGDLGILTP